MSGLIVMWLVSLGVSMRLWLVEFPEKPRPGKKKKKKTLQTSMYIVCSSLFFLSPF